MPFIFLVYLSAITLETLGCYISVIGLAAKTGPLIIFLAITLDFSKVMIATVLYKKWKDLHLLLKCILVPVLFFLVTVTSTGTYAYLVQEFGKTTAVSEQQKLKINLLQTEKDKLEKRKEAIDIQVSQLPAESVVQRKRMIELFAKESTYINDRLMSITTELPAAQLESMQERGNMGTLGSIASAYNVSPEQVTKIVAFFIVLVIDPLAIVLLTVANFLVEQRKRELKAAKIAKELISKDNVQDLKENIDSIKSTVEPINVVDKVEKKELLDNASNIIETSKNTPFLNNLGYKFNYVIGAQIKDNKNFTEDTSKEKEQTLEKDHETIKKDYVNLDIKYPASDEEFSHYHDAQKNIPIFEAETVVQHNQDETQYWDMPEDERRHDLRPIEFLVKKETNKIPGFNLSNAKLDLD